MTAILVFFVIACLQGFLVSLHAGSVPTGSCTMLHQKALISFPSSVSTILSYVYFLIIISFSLLRWHKANLLQKSCRWPITTFCSLLKNLALHWERGFLIVNIPWAHWVPLICFLDDYKVILLRVCCTGSQICSLRHVLVRASSRYLVIGPGTSLTHSW